MMNDSAFAKRARIKPENSSGFEGDGGREIPAPQGRDEKTATPAWKKIVARYQKPSIGRGAWQIINTLVPYAALWCLMGFSARISWWLTVPLAILAGAFLVRVFIIFHDCGHGSYFKSSIANHAWGAITGVLTFTPYFHWRWEHAIHHSSAGDLDRRGTGDVWTLTVQEYLESSRWKRFAYRLARNPVVLFVIAPIFLFLVKQRFPNPNAGPRERHSVYWTNLGILAIAAGLSLIIGLAALKGSSFYKLPKVLQWFSGNIGFHHIHHLSPRIPNYHLEKCHKAEPLFQTVKAITLFSSFKSFTFRLWDEQRRKLVGYGHLKMVRRQQKQALPR